MGGNPKGDKNDISNLMAMTREIHTLVGDIKSLKPLLRKIHTHWMKTGRAWLEDYPTDQEILTVIQKAING